LTNNLSIFLCNLTVIY